MKIQQISFTLVCLGLSCSTNAGQFDQLLGGTVAPTSQDSAVIASAQATSGINALEIIPLLTSALGIDKNQAEGGLGSLFNYAKGQLSSGQSTQLSSALPGLDSLVKTAPKVEALAKPQSGLGGLLSAAGQYNDSLKSLDQLNQQFEALGLKPEMISQFSQTAMQYLNSPLGQQAGQLLKQGLGALL